MPNELLSPQLDSPPLVVAIVYDGLCTFEYGIVSEVFGLHRPELGNDLYRFISVSLEQPPLRAAGGLTFNATGRQSDLTKAHTIVIPGWCGKDVPVPTQLIKALREANERGARFLSICSGGYVLAAAGLLDARQATTHWQYAQDFQQRFPKVCVEENHLYVVDGNVITSAGSSAGLDACLHIVRMDYGAKIANLVARRLVMHSHRQGSQAQFIVQPIPQSSEDNRLSSMMDDVRSRLCEVHKMSSMAQAAGMSSRTFQRRFQAFTGVSAMHWLSQERISRACELLEQTDHSIDKIGQVVGFGSTDTMRYHFRQLIEVSPAEYRKRFSS